VTSTNGNQENSIDKDPEIRGRKNTFPYLELNKVYSIMFFMTSQNDTRPAYKHLPSSATQGPPVGHS
jgi:hypothetical protein